MSSTPLPGGNARVRVRSFPFDDALEAEAAFARAAAEQWEPRQGESEQGFVWLDARGSDRDPGGRGRFGILAVAGGPWNRTVEVPDGSALQWLADNWRVAPPLVDPAYPGPFRLGWLGWLTYEGGGSFLFCDRALVLDRERRTVWALALTDDDDPAAVSPNARWLERLELSGPAPAPEPPEAPPHQFTLRDDERAYQAMVRRALEEIREGNSYEVCVTTRLSAPTGEDPWNAHARLRASSPAPFSALLRLGGTALSSSSPERLLSISADGTMTAEPIKGTRPRAADPDEDRAVARELAANQKDRAENVMILDLMRNDLSRVAEAGSLVVPRVCAVETYATVHQMVSTVTAQLAPGLHPAQAVASVFPAGSMTGAPKRSTMDILRRMESGPRGVYSGALGHFSLDGTCDLSVVIRTAVFTGGQVSLGVGGAVVADSTPEGEFAEIQAKARGVLSAFNAEFPR